MKIQLASVAMCLVAVLIIMIAPASAAVTDNFTEEISLTQFVPCAAGGAGEVVDVSGTLHVLVSATVNGNMMSGYAHFQPQGISGTGETTGEKYQATGITLITFKFSLQNGQVSSTFVNNFGLIGQGPGNNLLVHENMHITLNANGTITVTHDNFIIDCK